ncbi:MAG TPA: hypothetical protein QGI71_01430 [Dehalococcoidia bacterium]|nr:hypothetical protein [Dehalococcoidia bacterium]
MQELLEEHWPAMQAAVESGGGEAVVALIEGQADPVTRHTLYDVARRGLIFREWEGKNFDSYITVIDAGIKQLLAEADATAPDARVDVYRGLHALCYNLTADLADCWPDDDEPRSRSHHERGLRAADDCLRWLEHLPGPADEPRTRDHWARGIHLLALDEPAAAASAWELSLSHAETTAQAAHKSTAISVDGDFPVILASGYLALIRWIEGDPTAEQQFGAAIDAFLDQVPDETRRGAAELGIGQLQKIRTKYGPEVS